MYVPIHQMKLEKKKKTTWSDSCCKQEVRFSLYRKRAERETRGNHVRGNFSIFFFFLSANKTWHNDSENQSDCRLTNSKFSFQINEAVAVVDDDENVAEDEEALVEEAGDEDAGDQMEEANDNPNANNNGNNEEENVNQNAR